MKIAQSVIDDVLAQADIAEILGEKTEISSVGDEYRGLCPFHSEKTPSFTITPAKGLYYCFGCGAGGDVIGFVEKFDGISFAEAVKKLAEKYGIEIEYEQGGAAVKPKQNRKPLVKSSAEEGAARLAKKGIRPAKQTLGKFIESYDYVTEDGELVYQVSRFDAPKSFRQRTPDDSAPSGWSGSLKGVGRLPYLLPQFLEKPMATIIIVEGEKDVLALKKLGILATCNSGGAGNWPEEISHWFENRNVVIIPDTDPQQINPRTELPLFHADGRPKNIGIDHADDVARKLQGIAASVRVAKLPGAAEKEDCFDWIAAGGTKQQLIDLCKASPPWTEPKPVADYLPSDHDAATEDPAEQHTAEIADKGSAPFLCLGYDDGSYYYLPHRTQQVVRISAGSHLNTSQLLTLAPLEWWELAFPTKGGVDWTLGVNACIRWNERVGTFNSEAIRGRGAWFDEGRSVLHLGNQLLVDNVNYKLHDLKTKFIYEKKPALEALKISRPLSNDEAVALFHVTNAMNWTKPIDAVLLAGWCVLAPVCGAITWRPHIWLTGQKGTGKSWAIDNIIAPAIGGSALIVQSASTEAGIRQKLRQDARPVMFDEAEGENQHARQRMQSVLELARQASSDGLAEIAKGTAGGKALTYRVRSMFMLGSINVGLNHASDKSRFTILSMKRPRFGQTGREQFEKLEALTNQTLTKEWCAGLRSRTYGLIPIIRTNAGLLAKIAAEHIGNQRAGDQLGALLAGCYSLKSDAIITTEDARKWVESYDWEPDRDENQDSDEENLLNELLHSQLQIDTERGKKTRSVTELITSLIKNDQFDENIEESTRTLSNHGMRVMGGNLVVSASHPEIRKMLKDTQWQGAWARILERIPGAETKSSCRFHGVTHRAVSIPMSRPAADGVDSTEAAL